MAHEGVRLHHPPPTPFEVEATKKPQLIVRLVSTFQPRTTNRKSGGGCKEKPEAWLTRQLFRFALVNAVRHHEAQGEFYAASPMGR